MRGTAVRGSSARWSTTEDPRVRQTVRSVARVVAYQYGLEEDDLYQEGLLLVAATPHLANQATLCEYQLLYKRLGRDLVNRIVRPMKSSGEWDARTYRTVPIESAEAEEAPPIIVFDDGSGDYTEDAVKLLMPAVWDEAYAYGLPVRDDAPDKDMPKGISNKARSNTHWAYIADIKTGWERTPLTLLERRALLMAYGLGWTQQDIAFHERVSQQMISARIAGGIRKIVARLNGAAFIDEEDS